MANNASPRRLPPTRIASAASSRRPDDFALNPHICQIHDVGPGYLVLEYVEGTPLYGPLGVEEVVRLAVQIVTALEAAHRHGILHRDLKPGNILVTRNQGASHPPVAKLLDFGLAKSLVSAADATRTLAARSRARRRTCRRSRRREIGRCALGVFSLVRALRADLWPAAFRGDTSAEAMSAVLRDCHARSAPLIARVVDRCLEKDASRRYQTMAEVRAALEDAARVSPDREQSIAVLPFANLSADKENEYFSDGLAEEIINALTQIPGLKVTARTSAFAFRGKEQDIRKIAEALGVRTYSKAVFVGPALVFA